MAARATLYGIPNCDQVKKARSWLTLRHIAYVFHDLKKVAVDRALLENWLQQMPWETLLNRRGTTWRALSEDRRAAVIDTNSAIAVMLEAPSIIKRPVLTTGEHCVCGFSDGLYQQIFEP